MNHTFTYTLLLISVLCLFSSCFKEDTPVPPYVSPPGVTTVMAETKPDYTQQTYYDFESNSFVLSIDRNTWDLALDATPGGWSVHLNTSRKMRAFNTGSTDFTYMPDINDTNLVRWSYDESTGTADSTAIGKWGTISGQSVTSDNKIYLLDLGLSATGLPLGMKKIRLTGLQNDTYQLEYSDTTSGSPVNSVSITKNNAYNFMYFSFLQGNKVVQAEPPLSDYDLLFSEYTTRVYWPNSDKFLWYTVNGVLLNPSNVAVARDTINAFETIGITNVTTYTYSELRDAIGYNWKSYNINQSLYTIFSNRTYILRNRNGFFYKFRFVSFTNPQGQRGYPTFQVSKI